jgi:hypothetical protein
VQWRNFCFLIFFSETADGRRVISCMARIGSLLPDRGRAGGPWRARMLSMGLLAACVTLGDWLHLAGLRSSLPLTESTLL